VSLVEVLVLVSLVDWLVVSLVEVLVLVLVSLVEVLVLEVDDVVVESVQLREFDFDVYVLVPDTSDANTIRTPPDVAVKGDVTGSEKLYGLVWPSRAIVSSLFWTFPAGVAFDPLFAAR
jgi:hypothetical protein